MKRPSLDTTETTPEGLTALMYHIAHGAAQGQLDPEFVRKLSKRIDKELDLLDAAERISAPDKERLHHAAQMLHTTTDAEEGALLTRALERLRSGDASNAQPNA
ncbi:MAG: hypothetical protein CL858_15610 [Cupriavidus sp.]|jgi:hypothetical protein|uniref:hypothetical protein n=1 Tax=Cupriavidus pauculus TaxID=82633 RepID=UPI0007865D48|nr:hypothetical protein [Cupriavidus pauculus]MBU66859.1 hypothetical protein [Cupriavidus sp.]KAB0600091.1 hypothetical protein F7R19_22990 [Cupriavidus pauculus]MBY4732782.1 hypothetical protein [Cupriavidus pauculus]MCM3606069.1 hypothetical protein [Cupriavidus pauculus]UAL02902.1 hypothetical protein K8O84_19640 [Cupriavidus pauculus]